MAQQDTFGDFFVSSAIRTRTGLIGGIPESAIFYVKRNCSIGGDAFLLNGLVYLPTIYQGNYGAAYTQQSSLQPTYFLNQIDPNTFLATEVARIAQTNGGGPTLNQRCPQTSIDLAGNYVWGIGIGTQMTGGFNGQYQIVRGVSRAIVTFGVQPFSEILGSNLHLTGGFLSMYDGAQFLEHGYHVTPEPPSVDCCNIACCRIQIGVVGAPGADAVAANQLITSSQFYSPPNVGVLITAVLPGVAGNNIAINWQLNAPPVPPATSSPTLVTVGAGPTITIYVGIDQFGNTVENSAVADAINAYPPAAAIVTARWYGSSTEFAYGHDIQINLGVPNSATGDISPYPFGQHGENFTPYPLPNGTAVPWTTVGQSWSGTLTELPIQPGSVFVVDSIGTSFVGQDDGHGTITGNDNGATITGTIDYTTGAFLITFINGDPTGGNIALSWTIVSLSEINDVYFPPDTLNPQGTLISSGWQIRPSSFLVITAQSDTNGNPYFSGGGVPGGPLGYVWFSVDGIGADPAPFTGGPLMNECPLLSSDTAAVVAQKFCQAMQPFLGFVQVSLPIQNVTPPTGTSAGATTKVTITCIGGQGGTSPGAPVVYSEDLRLDCIRPIADYPTTASWMSCPAGQKIMPGGYFIVPNAQTVSGASQLTVVPFYYQVSYDGGDTWIGQAPSLPLLLPVAPGVPSPTPTAFQQIRVFSSDTPTEVAAKTNTALQIAATALGGFTAQPIATYGNYILISPTSPQLLNGLTPYNVNCGGVLPDGLYQYGADWEWPDAKGQFHQSGPSLTTSINIQGASPTIDPYGRYYGDPQSVLKQPFLRPRDVDVGFSRRWLKSFFGRAGFMGDSRKRTPPWPIIAPRFLRGILRRFIESPTRLRLRNRVVFFRTTSPQQHSAIRTRRIRTRSRTTRSSTRRRTCHLTFRSSSTRAPTP